jgi:hypothetical protein
MIKNILDLRGLRDLRGEKKRPIVGSPLQRHELTAGMSEKTSSYCCLMPLASCLFRFGLTVPVIVADLRN